MAKLRFPTITGIAPTASKVFAVFIFTVGTSGCMSGIAPRTKAPLADTTSATQVTEVRSLEFAGRLLSRNGKPLNGFEVFAHNGAIDAKSISDSLGGYSLLLSAEANSPLIFRFVSQTGDEWSFEFPPSSPPFNPSHLNFILEPGGRVTPMSLKIDPDALR